MPFDATAQTKGDFKILNPLDMLTFLTLKKSCTKADVKAPRAFHVKGGQKEEHGLREECLRPCMTLFDISKSGVFLRGLGVRGSQD